MQETTVKITLTALLSTLWLYLEVLAVPAVLLLAMMILDYVTGLLAASHRGQRISSYKSMNGIAKKICLLLLVAVGLALDLLVLYMKESFGVGFPWSFILSAVIAVWLTAGEILSVLENMVDIGVELPGWLLPLVKNLKSKVERVSINEKEDQQ